MLIGTNDNDGLRPNVCELASMSLCPVSNTLFAIFLRQPDRPQIAQVHLPIHTLSPMLHRSRNVGLHHQLVPAQGGPGLLLKLLMFLTHLQDALAPLPSVSSTQRLLFFQLVPLVYPLGGISNTSFSICRSM